MTAKRKIQFPSKLKPLFTPAPYKIVRGGRGSGKTWGFCRALLLLGASRQLGILCSREIQNSIDESVHKVLSSQIADMGFDNQYEVFDTEIVGKNGTRFFFAGLKNQFKKIKSYEAIDICAVFEATHISEPAWETLEPTIRRDPPFGPFGQGSEIWVEFNPDLATDATYKRFVLDPPEGAINLEMNYSDNPWFPEILRKQMEAMLKRDPDKHRNIWGGQTKKVLEGAIYARELAKAIDEKRISPHIRHDPKRPVIVVFDLGRADTCSVWFIQQVGMEYAVIDYYGNTGCDFSHYIDVIRGECEDVLPDVNARRKRYRVGKVLLPHDARHKVLAARFSIVQQARQEWGYERVPKPLPATPDAIRHNALRSVFPRLYFAEGPTQEGVQGLTHYRYGINDKGQRTQYALHDWASHPANSLEHFALSLQPDIQDRDDSEPEEDIVNSGTHYVEHSTGWMR